MARRAWRCNADGLTNGCDRGSCVNLERYICYWREKSEDVSPTFISFLAWLPVVARVVRCRPLPSERLGKSTALRKPVAHALSRTGDEFDRTVARSDACVRRARFVTLARAGKINTADPRDRARGQIYMSWVPPPAPAATRFLRSSLAAHN